MVTREEFLQLKSVVQELRSEMRKLQVDVLQRLAKVEDQLENSLLRAPPEPALKCVQCGSEYKESLNSGDTCRYHSGQYRGYQYECCKKELNRSEPPPGCRKATHHSKHHTDYPYEGYYVYMKEQLASAKEVWLEMDLIDPLLTSCLWSEVGLTQNDSLYIVVGSDKNTPTAILQYTMEQLAQCESYCHVALDKTGSTGWNLKVEIESSNFIATSITISMTSSFSPYHLLTKQLELLYERGTFRPGHVTCLSNPNEFVDYTLPGITVSHDHTHILPESTYEGPQLERVDYSQGRKNDYDCVTDGCLVMLRQYGNTSVSSTRKLANGKWNNIFTAVLSVTNQSSVGVAAREVYGEHLSRDGTTWLRCEQVFLAKEVLLEGGRSQEWLETADFFVEPTSITTWRISLAIQFGDDPPDYNNARKAHPSLPQPLHLRVSFVDRDDRTSSLRLEQGNPPLNIPTRESRQSKFCTKGKPLLFHLFADDITTRDRSDVTIYYDECGMLTFTGCLEGSSYCSTRLAVSKLLCLGARAKVAKKEEIVLEDTCENSTASIRGYLVTNLESGMPYAIKVFIKTSTSTSTGYCSLPHDDIGSPILCVEPQQMLVGDELTVQWALNRVSENDKIALYSLYGKSSIKYEYNTKAETSGFVKMKAPDTPGVYELRYYPGWLDSQNTVYRHSLHVAVATFEATAW